jgi:AraC-like DNA-binding protein
MAFTTIVPPPPLRQSIPMIWDWRVEPGELCFERILPQAGSGLIINLLEDETRVYSDDARRACERSPGAVFSGQFTRSFVIDSTEQIAVMGVAFSPGGAGAFMRERMDLLGNRHIALEDLVGASSRALRERLLHTPDAKTRLDVLQRWLATRSNGRLAHPAVEFALAELARAPQVLRIGAIAAASGLSQRRFGTLFREQVGIGAKHYARLQRFRAVVASVQSERVVEWTQVALDCGFHDQPHLVHEFRAFSGMTPSAYLAQRGPNVNHVPLT